jgi:hypothetical protein
VSGRRVGKTWHHVVKTNCGRHLKRRHFQLRRAAVGKSNGDKEYEDNEDDDDYDDGDFKEEEEIKSTSYKTDENSGGAGDLLQKHFMLSKITINNVIIFVLIFLDLQVIWHCIMSPHWVSSVSMWLFVQFVLSEMIYTNSYFLSTIFIPFHIYKLIWYSFVIRIGM